MTFCFCKKADRMKALKISIKMVGNQQHCAEKLLMSAKFEKRKA